MTGRGRPSTGVKVQVRIPADDLRVIDVAAEQAGMTRAQLIRRIIKPWARAERKRHER